MMITVEKVLVSLTRYTKDNSNVYGVFVGRKFSGENGGLPFITKLITIN